MLMNKKLLVLAIIGFGLQANAGTSIQQAAKDTEFSIDARAFYFNRSFDAPDTTSTAEAFALGGIAKMQTGDFYGAKIGAAYYGAARMFTDKDSSKGSSVLDENDGSNLSFIGELYYQQKLGESSLTVGRQRLATPLANDHDLRLQPTSYEAAVLDINALTNTRVQLGYIHKFTKLGARANGFEYVPSWTNKGIGYVFVEDKNLNNTVIKAQYAKALGSEDSKLAVKDYRYADITYKLPTALNTTVKAQAGGNAYDNRSSSIMLGAAIEFGFDKFDLGAVTNQIRHNNFKAIESGPMFSDWQQGYNSGAPSTAFGGYITLKPITGLSTKLGSVKIANREGINSEDFIESIADVWYTINKQQKLRLRYSYKDHTDSAGTVGRYDRQDFRFAYYLSF